jgi:hypothetical protein
MGGHDARMQRESGARYGSGSTVLLEQGLQHATVFVV